MKSQLCKSLSKIGPIKYLVSFCEIHVFRGKNFDMLKNRQKTLKFDE